MKFLLPESKGFYVGEILGILKEKKKYREGEICGELEERYGELEKMKERKAGFGGENVCGLIRCGYNIFFLKKITLKNQFI